MTTKVTDKVTSFNTGQVIQSVYAEYTTNADLSTVIPVDDTIPQITEGTEVLTASITPKYSTSNIRIRYSGFGGPAGAGTRYVAALFKDAGANALQAADVYVDTATATGLLYIEYQESASSTSARTYRIRVGSNTGSIRLNGSTGGRLYGGASRATLVVEEVAA